jgi:hypothetical protein
MGAKSNSEGTNMPAKFASSPSFHGSPHNTLASVKRYWLGLTALAVLLTLGACTSASSSAASDTMMTQASKLALGTLRLEGTEQPVSADLAAQLLPLWQLLAEMSTNAAAAPQETAAVVEQIQATMAPEQISAIDEMQLSEDDLANATWSASTTTMVPSNGGAQAAMPADGPMGAGGPPPDAAGGISLAGGGVPSAQSSSNSASTSAAGSGNAGSIDLIRQVISLLETKLQG